MKYYIVAGETSGDTHGASLMKHLINLDPEADIRFMGGSRMAAVGGTQAFGYDKVAVVGFIEVIKNLSAILSQISAVAKDIMHWQPDVVITIDLPGFNMRMMNKLKKLDVPKIYYITPQVWAWNQSRAWKLKKLYSKLLVILPFEQAFFKKYDAEAEYVGNPVLDAIAGIELEADFRQRNGLDQRPIVAVLPGSRPAEVQNMLAIMLGTQKKVGSNYQYVVAGLPHLPKAIYEEAIAGFDAKLVMDQTHQLVINAEAALVKSGTSTLETAILGTPQVVCYKGNGLSFWIAKQVVKVPYISLVNLIAEKEVVKELLQDDLTVVNLTAQLLSILKGGIRRKEVLDGYALLASRLGDPGASGRAAKSIVEHTKQAKR